MGFELVASGDAATQLIHWRATVHHCLADKVGQGASVPRRCSDCCRGLRHHPASVKQYARLDRSGFQAVVHSC